jgi:hypothetical protein
MKRETPRERLVSHPGLKAITGIQAGMVAVLGVGVAFGQSTVPESSSKAALPPESSELAVPGYLAPKATGPTGNGTQPANVATPGAGVANDFRSLQNLGNAGVPYLGGAGGAGGNGGGRLINWDRGSIGLGANLSFSYVDNAIQQVGGGNGEDFVITPTLTLSGTQAISENALLTMSVGIGYHYSLNYADLTQISLLPLGSLNYSVTLGEVLITFFDRVSSPANTRPEIVGNGQAAGVDFNRIENQVGVSSAWSITEETTLSGMYGYSIDRGLSDAYAILNRNSHNLSGGVFHRPSPYWSIGLTSQAGFNTFTQRFQNDSTSYGAGPVVSFRPNQFITLTAGVQYTVITFGTSGQITDRSDFSGVTWQGSATHTLSENLSHSVTFASGADSGLGSNYTESTRVGYQVIWRFIERMAVTGNFEYQLITQSSSVDGFALITVDTGTFAVPISFVANDEATLYQAFLGTGYQITDRTSVNLAYNYLKRSSRFSSRSFDVNTVTLAFNYQF